MLKLLALIWLPLMLLVPSSGHAQTARRVALVIGNSDYALESKLANPVNDAQLIARALKAQGFSVDVKNNLPKRAMELAIAAFVRQSAGAESAVLYYAGHGAQPANGGRNYLLPVDARVEGDDTLDTDGIAADRIVDQLERVANPARLRLVVLDACRNNRMAGKTRSGVRGLARMSPGDDYTLIAFSTNDQEVALDGSGGNSPYATALSQYLAQARQLPLRRIFELTATEVRLNTNQKQKPRTYGDLDSRMLLDGTQMASEGDGSSARVAEADPEEAAWRAAKSGNDAASYARYLASYPNGRYAAAARVGRTSQTAGAGKPAAQSTSTGQVFSDCGDCPEMVALPEGVFTMGNNGALSAETPAHSVSLQRFAMARTELTRAQFAAFVAATSYQAGNQCMLQTNFEWSDTPEHDWRKPGFDQTDTDPATCINWDDAQAYVRWLAQKTGKAYRLPSEAEWEYACHAGIKQAYCGSNSIANVAVYDRKDGNKTQPVANKKANAWGLYDMSGNVWEWVQDCSNADYNGAPANGSAWEAGNCGKRVLRGGSWNYSQDYAHPTTRIAFDPTIRFFHIGFRLARSLP
ncbi:MAG: SUMF1/EgtB/PvdO family nonheme iron enzyme [Pseudomonadota bacterium]